MADDLVKRLKNVRANYGSRLDPITTDAGENAISAAIDFIEAREADRDELVKYVIDLFGRDLAGTRTADEPMVINDAEGRNAIIDAFDKRPIPEPTFERKDGSTSPVRGGVVDRRESALGDYVRQTANKWYRREGAATQFGRRSDDRARWTAQPAPAGLFISRAVDPLTGHWFEKPAPQAQPVDGLSETDKIIIQRMIDRELDRRLSAMGVK